MQFGWTTAFWWLMLTAPIVLFYILKVRLRRVPVSTTLFWDQVFHEKSPRSIWQKLRHLLSLLLQLLFLLLVVLALADPHLTADWMQSRRVILIIDQSASMSANDVEPSRLTVAKEQAAIMIDSLRWRDEMAIIAAGSTPRVEIGLTSHQRTLRDVLDKIEPTDGTGSLPEALEVARRLSADHERAEIQLITDRELIEPETDEQTDRLVPQVTQVGTSADNLGITRFQVRRSLIDPIGFQILIEVSNFSDEDAETRLNVDLGEEIVDVIPLKLKAGEIWSEVLDHVSAGGGELIASLEEDDSLLSDNTARALLPKRDPQPILLFSDGNLFLRKVFEAIPYVVPSQATELDQTIPAGTVAVYHGAVPAKIPAAKVLIIDPQNETDLFSVGEPLESPIVAEQNSESELMNHVKLLNVTFPEAKELKFTGQADLLVSAPNKQPLYAALEHDGGKVLILSVDLNQGDLPLRTAFPIMISNALSWFQGEKGEWNEAYASGEIVTLSLDQDEKQMPGELLIRSPSGTETIVPAELAQITVGPLEEAGLWQLIRRPERETDSIAISANAEDEVVRQFVCNLSSAAESDLRQDVPETQSATLLSAGFGSRPLWFYLSLLALLLISTEWYLYQRRWIT